VGRPPKFEPEAAVGKAMEVFWQQGYAATTPQLLTVELGIGKGSLYNTFDSKNNLFTLALRRYVAGRLSALGAMFADSGPVKPRLREAVRELTGAGIHRRGCLAVNAIGELAHLDPSVVGIAADLFNGIEDMFRRAVEQGRRAGELAPGREPADAASALLATVIGTSVLARTGSSPQMLYRVIDDALAAL
jgi:TetR/AcrR family transcriptional repressor of nem operon